MILAGPQKIDPPALLRVLDKLTCETRVTIDAVLQPRSEFRTLFVRQIHAEHSRVEQRIRVDVSGERISITRPDGIDDRHGIGAALFIGKLILRLHFGPRPALRPLSPAGGQLW